jgi:peptidoglycan/LPS O-acetylase OafA/YrhL
LLYLAIVFISIPFLFNYTKSFKRDKFIGELSYPIYLTHLIVINALAGLSIFWHRDLLTMGLTFALSALMIKFVSNAIEHRRQKRLVVAVK